MRILIATNALTGHFRPLLPFANACQRAGHELLVVAPESFAPAIARAGLPHRPWADVSDEARAAAMAALAGLPPDEATTRLGIEIFTRLGPRAALPCMTDTIRTWRPHVILRETAELASLLAAERDGVPAVTVRAELASVIDRGTREHAARVAEIRTEAGLRTAPNDEWLRSGPYFTLVPGSLEDPEIPGAADTLRFRAPRQHPPAQPPWLPPGDDPLIYLSFGTVAGMKPPYSQLYPATIDALAALPLRLVVGLGDTGDPRWDRCPRTCGSSAGCRRIRRCPTRQPWSATAAPVRSSPAWPQVCPWRWCPSSATSPTTPAGWPPSAPASLSTVPRRSTSCPRRLAPSSRTIPTGEQPSSWRPRSTLPSVDEAVAALHAIARKAFR